MSDFTGRFIGENERPPKDEIVDPHAAIRRAKIAVHLDPLIRWKARQITGSPMLAGAT